MKPETESNGVSTWVNPLGWGDQLVVILIVMTKLGCPTLGVPYIVNNLREGFKKKFHGIFHKGGGGSGHFP